jgi:tetratricopeptide (TPR) repeat protein
MALVLAAPHQVRAFGSNEDSSVTGSAHDYSKAVLAVKDGRFADAQPVLLQVVARDSANADAWNYLGYSDRMLGKFQDSLSAYQKALALKPDHRGANEYLGKPYVQTGDLPKAREQLAKLEHICGGTNCEEYADLKDMIDGRKKKYGS